MIADLDGLLHRLGKSKESICGDLSDASRKNFDSTAQDLTGPLSDRVDAGILYVCFLTRLRRDAFRKALLGCTDLSIGGSQLYYDQLLLEVNDLLRSDIPRLVKRTGSDVADNPDYIKKKLLLLGMRTAALPFGKRKIKTIKHQNVTVLI